MIKITDMNSNTVIFSYTRKQALDDGALVDLTHKVRAYGLNIPFACTDTVWKTIEWPDNLKPGAGQSTEGRLHDVLMLAVWAARADNDNPRLSFSCRMVPRDGAGATPKKFTFLLAYDHGDHGEPVATLMFPDEE